MRVAVVGTGIAGLTAAWLFKRAGVDVTIFEKQPRLGMDTHGVVFEIEGEHVCCDVPPRMFNDSLWPNLSRLYRELGVESEPIEPSKSFARFDLSTASNPIATTVFLKLGASYQPKLSPNLLLNSTSRQILKDIKRMLSAVPTDLEHPIQLTMREYLEAQNYSDPFVFEFLYPALSSTVCTCSYQSLDAYPAEILLTAMLKLTSPDGLARTRHGTQDVVRRLSLGLNDIRLDTSVSNIWQTKTDASVKILSGESFTFDHVIVATQANAARRILDSSMEREDRMLSQFRYEDVPVVLHTDQRLMPDRRQDWSHFNLISNAQSQQAMCTIWMNRFCPEWPAESPVFQTIMPLVDPEPERLICSASMQRPVVDQTSSRGLELMADLHSDPDRHVWFCGSYASRGIPLLESGVVSSLKVAEKVGISWPDECSV